MKSLFGFWPTALLVSGYIVAVAGSNLCFKLADVPSQARAIWFFIAGNAIGFFCTIFITLALRGRNPNVIYAICLGGGFCALQLASLLVFKTPLSVIQWLGVGLIGFGIICLQFKA